MKRESINLYNLSRPNIDTALKAMFEDLEGCKVCLAKRKNGMLVHEEDCQYFACAGALWACDKRRG